MSSIECNITLPMPTITMTTDGYIDYSRFHLKSANKSMGEAEAIENRYEQSRQADELEIHMATVSSCIMCCVAAIESKINEFVFLNKASIDNTQITIDPIAQQIFPKLKITRLSQHILDITNVSTKFEILWQLSTKCPLPNSQFKENLIYLADLRNSLTHYTPEWKSESRQLKKLQKQIKNKFTINPFYPDKDALYFPFSFMSASCAKWAVQTCQEALLQVSNVKI